MEYVLKTDNLCKNYRRVQVLKNLNMNIPKGSIYGFVGRNGAGKTTLIRLICGLQKPTSGSFDLLGVNNQNTKELSTARERMGAIIENPAIYKNMTAVDNLKMQYLNLGLPDYEGIDELLELVGLSDTGKKHAGHFSLGMRQRLAIAIALCGNPDFIILDEPVNGLDPEGIIEIRELILKLNHEKGITILISSHILDELSRIATHYGFIDNGCIVREMSAEELEKECSKCIRIKISDSEIFARTMDEQHIEYKMIDDSTADVFSDVTISKLAITLANAGCELIKAEEKDESLESFYLSLLGGENNAENA